MTRKSSITRTGMLIGIPRVVSRGIQYIYTTSQQPRVPPSSIISTPLDRNVQRPTIYSGFPPSSRVDRSLMIFYPHTGFSSNLMSSRGVNQVLWLRLGYIFVCDDF